MSAALVFMCALIVLGRWQTVWSLTCSNNQTIGSFIETGSGNQLPDNLSAKTPCQGCSWKILITGNGYLMYIPTDDSNCCGVVSSWIVYLNSRSTATLYLQVWRPSSGSSYQLVGVNQFSINTSLNNQMTKETLTPSSKIAIRPGDRIGWYSIGGNNPITYHKNNPEPSETKIRSMSNPSVNDIVDWSDSNTTTSIEDYFISAYTDVDSIPSFNSPSMGSTYTISNSKAIGDYITTLVWSDTDITDALTASMTTTSTIFSFNTSSGALTVASSLSGPTVTHSLSFTVTDYCGNLGELSISVTVVNEPPILYGLPASKTLSEDSAGDVLIYTINATDTADTVSCSFVTNVSSFSVRLIPDSSNYGIYVDSSPNFNYNTQNQYSFDIRCSDGYANSTTGTFYLYLVKNQPPVISNLQGATTLSTNATLNTIVFKVAVTDSENDTYTFDALVCDPSPCPFVIRNSGDIQLTQDISGLNTSGFDLNITVRDGKNVVGPKILTVIIKDINDPVLISNLPISNRSAISENTALATSVFAVSISDQDVQTWTYSMSSTAASGLSYFSINSSTGLISTTASILNYEKLVSAGTTVFTFTISVSDGKSSDMDPLVIEIIDVNEAPSFSTTAYSISHSEGMAGTVIGTPSFGVTDPDSGDSYTYSMTCGSYTSLFHMDSLSGQVSFQSNYDTDSGKPTSVNCTVTVTDSGGLTDTSTLDIFITDINDNTPVFVPSSYSFFISYYSSVGTPVGTVTATDGDTGIYGILTYTLDQANLLDEYFTIDNNGQISIKKTPYGNRIGYATSVTINATVTDAGGLKSVAPINIIISDTTTTSTTTTTDRFRTFIEDNRNIAWLIPSIITLFVIVFVMIWIVYTCKGDNSFANFKRMLCNKRKQYKPRRVKKPQIPPTPAALPRSRGPDTIRLPPPPKEHQMWRSDVETPLRETITRATNKSYDFWKHTNFTDNSP